jgi:hypothetical protein
MELYQIRHFAAVVETGSFTKAAIRAAVSQPALSVSMAKLEEDLACGCSTGHRSQSLSHRPVAGLMRPRRRFYVPATR